MSLVGAETSPGLVLLVAGAVTLVLGVMRLLGMTTVRIPLWLVVAICVMSLVNLVWILRHRVLTRRR